MPVPDQRFSVTYHITARDNLDIKEYARDIAIEQTVEIPYDCIPEKHFKEGLIGNVEEITLIDESHSIYKVIISYRCDITAFSIPQLLNVLFGNISLKNNIKLVDLSVPESMQEAFSGPGKGIQGIRKILGIYGRPLACTALKPMGFSSKKLAVMAEAYARGGIDIIKDDHGIGNQQFSPFNERIALCQEAVEKVNAKRERKTLYFPMVSGRFDEIEDQVCHATSHGVKGILIAPMLVGPDTVRYLSQQYNVIIMAHPALTGSFFTDPAHGMTPAFLLGTLFRLIGADISIFPNAGGRFNFTGKECVELANALRRDAGIWKNSFPCPAGGMKLDRIGEIAQVFGKDTVLLIGGSIMSQYTNLTQGVETFMDRIRKLFNEQPVKPLYKPVSPCKPELPVKSDGLLKFHDFQWSGLEPEEYKPGHGHDSKDVVRHELIGKSGISTKFDLRYFEIKPGGYSSLEKHEHEHVIIGARGSGILLKGEQKIIININDIAYIAPFKKHQLHNQNAEPFGFYCIVDNKRDRPVPL